MTALLILTCLDPKIVNEMFSSSKSIIISVFPDNFFFCFVSKERMIIYGIIVVLIMVFRPKGMVNRDLMTKTFSLIRRKSD